MERRGESSAKQFAAILLSRPQKMKQSPFPQAREDTIQAMNTSWKEISLEETIANHLVEVHGYEVGHSAGFAREFGVDTSQLLRFLENTQKSELDGWKTEGGAKWLEKLLLQLRDQIHKRGVVALWREGLKCGACRFQLYFARPLSPDDPAQALRFASNVFSVTRQLHFSAAAGKLALDLGIFVNGIPLATFELKNAFTNQNALDARRQYQNDRSSKEPIFGFKHCLVHFAADSDEVWMTSKLQDDKTVFYPFNLGTQEGGGNPVNPDGLKTSYLWEDVLSKPSVAEIIEKFAQLVREPDDSGVEREKLLFPRVHQRDAVRRLLAEVRQHGAGGAYLIQHSAGSGKSNTISWLAHQLVETLSAQKPAFDCIVIITDRRVLDNQIARTIKSFDSRKGLVVHADESGKQLAQLLNGEAKIVISTLQKFDPALKAIQASPDKKFAIVIDEAHSSQSGDGAATMNGVLGGKVQDHDLLDYEDKILAIIGARKQLKNASYFAFTATPKNRTLEAFGIKAPTPEEPNRFVPFHAYTMRQAIAEGFILDVLKNYRSLQSVYRVQPKTESNGETDPQMDVSQANKKLRRYVEQHTPAIERKARVMLGHFERDVQHLLNNGAKAMVVTSGIESAIRYKWAFDKLIAHSGLGWRSLVAFSGEKTVEGVPLTENGINQLAQDDIPREFKKPEVKFLIVAEKFQTGFDEPMLSAMYVDKPLGGIQAVQTLSRLNRCAPTKNQTFVLDFFNRFETVAAAFKDYYEVTHLTEEADLNRLNDLESALDDAQVFSRAEVEQFCTALIDGDKDELARRQKCEPMLDAVAETFKTVLSRDEQITFKGDLKAFVRAYEFFAAVRPFVRPDWEELALFGRFLLPKLPILAPGEEESDILERAELVSYRLFERPGQMAIPLEGGGAIEPTPISGGGLPPETQLDRLSVILENFNARYGKEADGSTELLVTKELPDILEEDATYQAAKKHSGRGHAFDAAANAIKTHMQKHMMSQTDLYKRFVQDADFQRGLIEDIFRNDYDNQSGGGASL